MTEPKTLEEAIQIINSLKRCGICKHYRSEMIVSNVYAMCCRRKHKELPYDERSKSRVKTNDTCEHWE